LVENNWISREVVEYYERIQSELNELTPFNIVKRVEHLVQEQEKWIDHSCINLYAASNVMSPRSRALLSSSLATRVTEGHPGKKHQKGSQYLEHIEAIVVELSKRLFHANYAEVRVLSGSMANAITFNALTKPSDVIMSLTVPAGGHISYRKFGAAGYRGLQIENIPFDPYEMEIDVEELALAANKIKPQIIVLGASLILYPYPLEEIKRIAENCGAFIHYDGAHVGGLIAGGAFQNPLSEGADVLTMSTYKTFGGPPGGIITCNDAKIAEQIDRATFPGLTANVHYHRLAALAVTLAELMTFGPNYASQTIGNAKYFAEALANDGFDVLTAHKGYTQSHQVVVDVSSIGGGRKCASALEQANIICNQNLLPTDRLKAIEDPNGLRLGVQELTRLGLKEPQMREISEFIRMVLIDAEDPKTVVTLVKAFREDYNTVHYCFESDRNT